MPRRYILTASERVLVAIPTDETALIRLYTLSEQDLSVIKQRRGDANRLGFAVLLCCLRYPGYALPAGEDVLDFYRLGVRIEMRWLPPHLRVASQTFFRGSRLVSRLRPH
jgi:Domain of unknown function (DUF4158)